jgi:hypothetical protein
LFNVFFMIYLLNENDLKFYSDFVLK